MSRRNTAQMAAGVEGGSRGATTSSLVDLGGLHWGWLGRGQSQLSLSGV